MSADRVLLGLRDVVAEESTLLALESRAQTWQSVRRHRSVDLLVLGDSYAAAAFAHGAVLNGLSVLVVSPQELGASEKDGLQVLSWLSNLGGQLPARAIGFRQASRRFAGLLGLRNAAPHRLREVPSDSIEVLQGAPPNPKRIISSLWSKLYQKVVALFLKTKSGESVPVAVELNPYLLTTELWLSARLEGCQILPFAKVQTARGISTRQFEVVIEDRLSGETLICTCGALVDFENVARRPSVARAVDPNRDWAHVDGYFVPPPADLLSDRITAFKGITRILVLSDATRVVEVAPFASRRFPGAGGTSGIRQLLLARGVADGEAEHLLARYGYQARHFVENPGWLSKLPGGLYAGQIYYAVFVDGCVSIAGIARNVGVDTEVAKAGVVASRVALDGCGDHISKARAQG